TIVTGHFIGTIRIGAWKSSWPAVRSRHRWDWRWRHWALSPSRRSPHKPRGELKGSLGPCKTASSLSWVLKESRTLKRRIAFSKYLSRGLIVALRSAPENPKKPGVRSLQISIWTESSASAIARSWAMITAFELEV